MTQTKDMGGPAKPQEVGVVMITHKQAALLRMASRPCGMSYRAACKRNTEQAITLKNQGLLRLSDNGKDLSRFVYWITEKGKVALNEYENRLKQEPKP